MRGHDPPKQEHAEVHHVLDRVKRQAAPRSGVHVAVMEVVDVVVDPAQMQHPVDAVEVGDRPQGREHREHRQVQPCGVPFDLRYPAVGVEPHGERLVRRPHRTAADQAPEDVVAGLVVPQELAVGGAEPQAVVLVALLLGPPGVQHHVQRPRDQREHHHVAHIDLQDPSRAQCCHALHRRGEEVPHQRGHRYPDHPLGGIPPWRPGAAGCHRPRRPVQYRRHHDRHVRFVAIGHRAV